MNLAILLLSIVFLTTPSWGASWPGTEADFLNKNKTYTDALLKFLLIEETSQKQLADLKSTKKTTESNLKKATTALTTTTQQLTQAQAQLVSLKDKELNKVQLQSSLLNQKQQNLTQVGTLNSKISSAQGSLQNINFAISQLQNEKQLILNKVSTQTQLVRLAQNNVDSLEREIFFLNSDIDRDRNRIRDLRQDIQLLQAQKAATEDPAAKAQIQADIERKRQRIQDLEFDITQAQASINNKEIRLINEKSQLSQAQSELNRLDIQLNGKENEIASQVRQQDQLENEIASYQSQKSNYAQKNKNIDAELDVLANITTYIAKKETEIKNLTALKSTQSTAATQLQTELNTVTLSLTTLQTSFDAQKATLLASEKDYDTFMKLVVKTPPTVNPVILAEGTIGIDSLLVTEELDKYKDWTVFKGTSTTLGGAAVCAASTQVLDSVSGVLSELLVVKMIDANGVYSSPFIMSTHSQIADLVIQGQLKTDKIKAVAMPLLQSPVANEKALLARYADNATLISYLKAHNSARVEFTVPGAPVAIPFSLRGSSNMVNAFLEKCKN